MALKKSLEIGKKKGIKIEREYYNNKHFKKKTTGCGMGSLLELGLTENKKHSKD